MSPKIELITQAAIETRIFEIRGQKVILDSDLSKIYKIPTFRLNEAVKRNQDRFPKDFMFQLTRKEVTNLTSQIAMSRSGHGGRRTLPYAFTEHGALMAAAILKSPSAIEMSVFIVRAFVKMREQLLATATLAKRLAEVEKLLLVHDSALGDLYQKIQPLLMPPEEPEKKRIGFDVRESRAKYCTKKENQEGEEAAISGS